MTITPNEKILCIYHANCNDGVLAAAIVKYSCNTYGIKKDQLILLPMNYDDDPIKLLSLINKNTYVIFVDFSLKSKDLLLIAANAASVQIYDHHISAKKELLDIEKQANNISCTFDMTRSGAGITWDKLFPTLERALIVSIIEDRDLWKFRLPVTKSITAIIRDKGMSIDQWMLYLAMNTEDLNWLANKGKAVLDHDEASIDSEIDKQIKQPNIISIEGVPDFHAFNSTTLVSEQLNTLLKHAQYKLNAAVSFRIKNKQVQCSARSIDDESALIIAKYFNGGGHNNASGFTISIEHAMELNFFR